MITLQQIREKIQQLEVQFIAWMNDKPEADLRQATWELVALVNTQDIEQDARQTALAIDKFRERFDEWLPHAEDIVPQAGLQNAMLNAFKEVRTISRQEHRWPTLESPSHLLARSVPEEQMMKIYGMRDRRELQAAIDAAAAGKWEPPPHPNEAKFFASINAEFENREIDEAISEGPDATPTGKRPPEAKEKLEKLFQLGCSLQQIQKMKPSLTKEQILQEAEELGFKLDSSGMPRPIATKAKQREEAASEALERLASTDIDLHGEAPSTRERIILIHRDHPELTPAKIANLLVQTAPEVSATMCRDVIYQVNKDKQSPPKPKRGRKKKDESSNGTGTDRTGDVQREHSGDARDQSGSDGEENPSAGSAPARSG